MVLIFLNLMFLANAGTKCDLTTSNLLDLRISLLCSCEDDITSCASLIDAEQLQRPQDISAAVGAAIGTHINFVAYSPYTPKERVSSSGFNDWSSVIFKSCSMLPNANLKRVLSQSIDKQVAQLNSDKALCKSIADLYQGFSEAHFTGRCTDDGGVAAKPKNSDNEVEHTVSRLPASLGFAQKIRSHGGETAPETKRPFAMNIKGKGVTLDYILPYFDNNHKKLAPTKSERAALEQNWRRHKREFIEMVNCCQTKELNTETCGKYKISE